MTGAEVLIGATILQGVTGFVGGIQEGKTQKANAAAAVDQAAEQERQFRIQALRRQGAGTVAAASQGAGIDSLDILSSNAATEELDALMIRYGGEVKATEFRNKASAAKTGAFGSLFSAAGAGAQLFGGSTSSLSGPVQGPSRGFDPGFVGPTRVGS